MKKFLYEIKDYIIIVVAVILIRSFIVTPAVVDGASMDDTLKDGQLIIINKINYRFNDPKRFQIVVVKNEKESDKIIKRIIGLPGETVKIDDDGNIYINGELLEEYYGREVIEDPGMALNEITLGEDEYFCLGDNRNNSIDSRFEQVGCVKEKDILGHVFVGLSPWRNPDREQAK